MGRIVAIGGGDLQSTEKINQYIINLSGADQPNLLFIGTASVDAYEYIESIHRCFEKLNCAVKELSLYKEKYQDHEIDELFSWADIIYVGGGDTRSMIETWKKYQLDEKLKKIYQEDSAVLTGISAGAMCWFYGGHSDSESFSGKKDWNYIFVENMLNIYPYYLCPHYNEPGRESFDQMMKNKNKKGIALENETAFADINGQIIFLRCRKDAKAYWIEYENGKIKKTPTKKQMLHI